MNACGYDLSNKKVWVAGHKGLVGAAMIRALSPRSAEILTVDKSNLDLRDQSAVMAWMREYKPDVIILAAAKVGGIAANMAAPAEFIYDNLMIEANVIHSAYLCGVEKLLFLGSSCIYPKDAPNPIVPEMLMSGALEPSNAPYAMAKIAGIEMCKAYRSQYGCDFISAMPCNLYGPNDHFDFEKTHVIPALLMRAHAGKMAGEKVFEVWGSGQPKREFLYVDDLADALVMLLQGYNEAAPVNVGSGDEITIAALAQMVLEVVEWDVPIQFNRERPDGTASKLLDSSYIRDMGWKPLVHLRDGLGEAYQFYCCKLDKL